MPDREFSSLDEYESFILAQITPWSPARRTVLAAAMAERWLPAYEAFSATEDWGDPAILRRSLDAVWNTAAGRASSSEPWSRLSDQIDTLTPHLDDFDANEALCACVMIQYAIDCCKQAENQSAASMAVLSGLEAVRPDLLTVDRVPSRFWKQAALHRELNKQLRVLERIDTLTDLAEVSQVLRPFLTSPEMIGEPRPRKKSQHHPVEMSNHTAFEVYRKMVQSDIRGAAKGLDPRNYPDLATGLYLAAWLGRYHRRKEIISGGYGALADHTALNLLVAKNRALDLAEKDLPAWEASVRWIIDVCYQNPFNELGVGALEEPHGYGPSLRRLWVEAKRRGLSDPEAWESIKAWAHHPAEAWSTKSKGEKKKLAAIRAALQEHLNRPLSWNTTGELNIPWVADVDGELWQVRLNDFPDEFMYSLLISGQVAGDFHDWPKTWKRE